MTDHLPAKPDHPALPPALAERIDEYTRHARGALASNTERAYRAVFHPTCPKSSAVFAL